MSKDMVSTIERDNQVKSILSILTTLYKPPIGREDPKFPSVLELYTDALRRWPADTLKVASLRFQQEWGMQRWPVPGELTKIVAAVHRELHPPEPERDEPKLLDRPQYSKEHRERMIKGLKRVRLGLKNGYVEEMSEGEWFAWCKRGEVPERLAAE